jgi:hypothetical protein
MPTRIVLCDDHAMLDAVAARAQAVGLIELVRGVQDTVRSRAQGLRPAALDDLGLLPALRSAALRWGEAHGLSVELDAPDASPRLPAPLETVLFRVAEEAVANAGRHAGAARVEVRLRRGADWAELQIVDDGHGFDAAQPAAPALGLAAMRERVALVGGELSVASQPGLGVSVVARVPLTPTSTTSVGVGSGVGHGGDGSRLDCAGTEWEADARLTPTASAQSGSAPQGERCTDQNIPGARLVALESGGHLLLGHWPEVRSTTNTFLRRYGSGT